MEDVDRPLPVTLAGWSPKCNAQKNKRAKLDFEIPLTTFALSKLPQSVQAAASSLAVHENGIVESDISLEFNVTMEIHNDQEGPVAIYLPLCKLTGLVVFRPTVAKGSPSERFLWLTTTVGTDGDDGRFAHRLIDWLWDHMQETVYIKTHEIQGSLEGLKDEEAHAEPAKAREQALRRRKTQPNKA